MLAFLRRARRRNHSGGRESFALRASGGAGSLALRRLRADGSFQPAIIFPAIKETPYPSRSGRTAISGLSSSATRRDKRRAKNAVIADAATPAPNLALCWRRPARADRARHFAGLSPRLVAGSARRRERCARCGSRSKSRFGDETARSSGSSQVSYTDGAPETYALAGADRDRRARRAPSRKPRRRRSSRVSPATEKPILHDAIWDADFPRRAFPAHDRAAHDVQRKVRQAPRRCQQLLTHSRPRRRAASQVLQRGAKQFLDALRQQIFPEALSQTGRRRESRTWKSRAS